MAARSKSSQRRLSTSSGVMFRRSANLEQDASRADPGFLLTGCVLRALTRLVEPLRTAGGPRAWTLTGPYGTGKSSFAVYLTSLLATPTTPSATAARKELHREAPGLSQVLDEAVGASGGLLPVVITGAREPLSVAIVRGIASALTDLGSSQARRLAAQARAQTSPTSAAVLRLLGQVGSLVESNNSPFQGLLLVVDELGKLLEYAASHKTHSDVYLLQQLAESASRARFPFLLVGILHQDFGRYAQDLPEADRTEWEKIRGRFDDLVFEQSADDMLRLLAQAQTSTGRAPRHSSSHPQAGWEKTCKAAWSCGFAPPSLSWAEGFPLLAACYPLHPSVTLLLGPVFKRYGQNERSAFSFLRSGEPFGLADFVSRSAPRDLYTLVDLCAYLIATTGDALLIGRDGRNWAEALDIEAKHPHLSSTEARVLRVIAILGIVGRWQNVSPTRDAIRFALAPADSSDSVDAAISSLVKKSAVVERRFNNSLSLWEGSDIDVEKKLLEARSHLSRDARVPRLLATHFAPRSLVARRHTYETGTLRFFDVLFTSSSCWSDTQAQLDTSAADGHVLIFLPDSESTGKAASPAALLAALGREDVLLCVPANRHDIESCARELAAIDSVRQATPELHADTTARRELAAREAEVRRALEQGHSEMLFPARRDSERSQWFGNSGRLSIDNPRVLNEQLSAVCDVLYSKAPTIQNEIINRRDLSSSAAAARQRLFSAMATKTTVEALGIEGNPPEKSVYLSVLRALGLHQHGADGFFFASSSSGVERSAQPLFHAIRTFFEGAHAEPHSLDRLFDVLRAPPFGVRDGVLPVLIVAALLGSDADVALYEGGAFVTSLTDDVFQRLVKNPAAFAVRRWHVEGVRSAVFEHLAKMVGQSDIGESVHRRDILDVVKPLMRFIRKLDGFAMKTRTLSPQTLSVRAAMVQASEPDLLLFRDLPLACGLEPFTTRPQSRQKDVAAYVAALQSSISELRLAYDRLLTSLVAAIAESLDVSPGTKDIRTAVAQRATAVRTVAIDPGLRVFVTRLGDTSIDERTWIESCASYLASKHPSAWLDADRTQFSVRLQQHADAIRSLESLLVVPQSSSTRGGETIRIAVVGTQFAQVERVVHLDDADLQRVSLIEAETRKALLHHKQAGSPRLLLAALARITRSLVDADTLTEPQPSEVAK